MESTQQASGGAARHKRRRGESFSGCMRSCKDFENLINALKLLANKQRDGDSLIQNIFTGLREKNRERITDGLRSFIAQDTHCAVEVATCAKASGLSGSKNRQ